MLCILARTAYRFKRYQIVIIPDNRIIAGNTYTACYYKSFGINPNNGNQMTPPTLVEPENDKIFERLHTARTAIPNHLPAITLLTNPAQTRIHPWPPAHPRAPLELSCFLCFFPLFMRVSGVFGLRVGVFGKAPEYKKSPMPWGFHSTRLLWFTMLFWASEMAAVTLN